MSQLAKNIEKSWKIDIADFLPQPRTGPDFAKYRSPWAKTAKNGVKLNFYHWTGGTGLRPVLILRNSQRTSGPEHCQVCLAVFGTSNIDVPNAAMSTWQRSGPPWQR